MPQFAQFTKNVTEVEDPWTLFSILWHESIKFSSDAQSCSAVCDWSTPGLPVHHQFPEFTQTHVHWVGDAIQPSHPLSSLSPPALNLCQHQGLFQMSQLFASGGQSIGVSASASVLPMNTQDWSPLGWTGWICLQSKGLSWIFITNQCRVVSISFPLGPISIVSSVQWNFMISYERKRWLTSLQHVLWFGLD